MPDMINEKIKSAEILCIGTELLLGDIVNTNAAYLAGKLAGLGIPVFRQGVVGDNPERLRAAMAESPDLRRHYQGDRRRAAWTEDAF